jgi:plastocyanin
MRKLIPVAAVVATAGVSLAAIPAFAATRTTGVRDDFFSPKSLTVKKNTTVKWIWKGTNPHNVHVTKGPIKFKSAVKTSGTYSKKLTRKGTYRIVCDIHAGMKQTIRVN